MIIVLVIDEYDNEWERKSTDHKIILLMGHRLFHTLSNLPHYLKLLLKSLGPKKVQKEERKL